MARVSARRLLDEDPAERAVAAADAGARWARVMDAIGTLPEAERQVLLLFAWEELSHDEIALALGVPVGTVRSRLSRGRARLAALTQDREKAVSCRPSPDQRAWSCIAAPRRSIRALPTGTRWPPWTS